MRVCRFGFPSKMFQSPSKMFLFPSKMFLFPSKMFFFCSYSRFVDVVDSIKKQSSD